MKRESRWLLIVLLAACCMPAILAADESAEPSAETDASTAAERLDARLDELLEETLVGAAYGDSSNCLFARAYRKVRVVNDRVLLFEGPNRYWLNRLKRKCVGLTRDMALMLDHKGPSVCSSDHVQGRRRVSGPHTGTSICSLGSFEEVDEQHALMLIDTLR